MHEDERSGAAVSRRAVQADFSPALVRQVAGMARKILREHPPGKDGPPFSPALTRHVVKTFAAIVIHSVTVGLAHSASRRRREP
jgi:hypothetical protein